MDSAVRGFLLRSAYHCDGWRRTGLPHFEAMNYDRGASSFGRTKQSDPANSGYGQGQDDISLSYPNEASSLEHINPSRPSAGYNRDSFRRIGRQEPVKGGPDEEHDAGEMEAWDVYADFNNAGPRYSSAFGTGQPQTQGG